MNDDFLTRFRKPPRPEFAATLYKRISQPMHTQRRLSAWSRVALAVSALCVAFVLTMFVSPAARAAVLSLVQEIGGVSFLETPDYPGGGKITIVPEETLTLAEAQAALPFSFNLPRWTPDGFTRDEMVRIARFSDEFTPVTITWRGKYGEFQDANFELVIGQSTTWVSGPDSVETVDINGQPAALFHGGWNADTQQWDENITVKILMWTRGDVTFSLSSLWLSADELIHIAESVP